MSMNSINTWFQGQWKNKPASTLTRVSYIYIIACVIKAIILLNLLYKGKKLN